MNVRRFLVAAWLSLALGAGVAAWLLAPHRFLLGTMCVLFVACGAYVARTSAEDD